MDLVQVLPNALKCPCVSIKYDLKKQGIKTPKPLISQGFQVSVSILVTQHGCGDGICLPRKTGFAGAPLHLTASVAGKTGSLRHCAALAAGRSRAARYAVPPGVSAETPAIERGGKPCFLTGKRKNSPSDWTSCFRMVAGMGFVFPAKQVLRGPFCI